jgi:hypothetical protein
MDPISVDKQFYSPAPEIFFAVVSRHFDLSENSASASKLMKLHTDSDDTIKYAVNVDQQLAAAC